MHLILADRRITAINLLSLLILQQQKHQIGTGTRRIYGILFDGAWLWEEYVNTLTEDLFYHPMNKGGTGAQRLFTGNVGLIYPDFIGRSPENHMTADAKYKPIGNIGNRDYLQLLAYMFRFSAKKGFFFYPEAGKADNLKLWMNQGSTYEKNVQPRDDVSITKLGLEISADYDDFESFAAGMKRSEQQFRKTLLEQINN